MTSWQPDCSGGIPAAASNRAAAPDWVAGPIRAAGQNQAAAGPIPAAASSPAADAARPPRPPLLRSKRGRVIAGVCAGLAAHLGVSVTKTRWIMAVAVLAMGAGLVLYIWLWLTIPAGDPRDAQAELSPPALMRLAPRLREPDRRAFVAQVLAGVVLVVAAGLVVASRAGANVNWEWIIPAAALIGGVILAWSQLERTDRYQWGSRPVSLLRLVASITLVVVGLILMVGQGGSPQSLLAGLLAGSVTLAGVAVVLAPWWLRLVRALGDERSARARESERADIAAHLHDSVLQTLAIIRTAADDAETVRRLARAQERELRAWLYEDRAAPGTSLAAQVRQVVAEVEDSCAIEIGSVIVGDIVPTMASEALLRAAREALLNAARHSGGPVSIYCEVSERGIEIFVRDRGSGFDPAAVPADRLGVRESIIGRVERQGGTATVNSVIGEGTQVSLRLPAPVRPSPQEAKR